MKRVIAVLLILVMVFALCSCGKSDSSAKKEDLNTSGNEQPEQASETAVSSASTQAMPSSVEWKEIKYETTDNDGYTFEVTYRFSPWILISNGVLANAVWAEVSNGKPFPYFDDWGLESYHNGYWRANNLSNNLGGNGTFYCPGMNDMYYCMGSLSIRNITEGWSLSESNKRSRDTMMVWRGGSGEGMEGAPIIGHLFLSDKIREEGYGILVNASMTSDEWGPFPFILMAPESFTPNHPDGRYYKHFASGSFNIGDHTNKKGFVSIQDVKIGIIGKDGTYAAPAEEAAPEIEVTGLEIHLKKTGNNSYSVTSDGGDKTIVWDGSADSYYDKDTGCWAWFNTDTVPNSWQYWYEGISSDYGDYGWLEHGSDGWFVEASAGNWIPLPSTYDTSGLWYID